jgi:RNA-directed DNA polymerase
MHTSTDLTDTELKTLWQSLDWNQIENSVSNLQARIARAALEKRWNEVKRLTRLLTRSHSAKLLAVRQVTTSKGKNTPGVDGIVWKTPAEKMRGALSLNDRGYRALPLKRIYIPKKNGKLRPLSIPTIRDRAMQALFALALAPIEYATDDRSSFGFRKYRSTKDACHQVLNCLSKKHSAQWVLEADIKACFDTISHDWLLTHIPLKKKEYPTTISPGWLSRRTPSVSNDFRHTPGWCDLSNPGQHGTERIRRSPGQEILLDEERDHR